MRPTWVWFPVEVKLSDLQIFLRCWATQLFILFSLENEYQVIPVLRRTHFYKKFLKAPFLHFSLLYINDLPDDVICNIAVYADDTTLFSKRSNAPDSWQQLELAYGLESDLRDTGLG